MSTRKKRINFYAVTPEMSNLFCNNVVHKLSSIAVIQAESNIFLNETLVKAIRECADTNFPVINSNNESPSWHTDVKLQELFSTKSDLIFYKKKFIKSFHKKIRLRARYLQNEYFKSEAEKIKIFAINKELKKLFA